MLQPTKPVEEIVGHNVVKNDPNAGPVLDIGAIQLIWKAQGEDTGYSFSIFEMTLLPGYGLPLHKHPFAEFFYVVDGTVDFGRWNDTGTAEWMRCDARASVLAPPNAPHTFFNKSDQAAQILSVSTYHHERMLKDAVNPHGQINYLPTELSPEGFERLFKSMEENQCYIVGDRA